MALEPVPMMLALAFLPALLYLATLAARARGRLGGAALAFAYGATASLAVLGVLYVLFAGLLQQPAAMLQALMAERAPGAGEEGFAVIVLLAPALEEAAKALGVVLLLGRAGTPREGALLGGAVGLGFAGTETFTYLVAAWGGGGPLEGEALLGVLLLAGARSVTSAFLHPAATALTGYGIGWARTRGVPSLAAAPFWLAAAALHGAYNYLAAFLPPQDVGGLAVSLNLPAALLLAALSWGALKRGVAARA